MFGFARGVAAAVRVSAATRCFATARCDEAEQADDGGFGDTGSFAESGRDDEGRKGGAQFAQPMLFENLAGTLRQGSVNNYDGFRLVLQKQVNLNTITSHFYWIGSQSVPPIYQYRLILPFEDKQVNVATDMDFNIEGEVRVPLGKGLSAKTNFSVHEQQGNNLSVDVDLVDDSSATQVVYSPNGNVFTLSFMQSLNKYLILGGQGEYAGNKGALALSFGGVYDDKENVLGCQWDTAVSSSLFRVVLVPPARTRACVNAYVSPVRPLPWHAGFIKYATDKPHVTSIV